MSYNLHVAGITAERMIKMTRCCRIAAALALLAVVASVITGCGGGGGSNPPGANFTITGKVQDYHTNDPIVGAVVTIAGASTTTDSTGSYRLTYDTKPVASTWSVDGTSATPVPGYYVDWARMGMVTDVFDAQVLPMSDVTNKVTTMQTVYLWSKDRIPPD